MAKYQKFHKPPTLSEINLAGEVRPMEAKDLPQVHKLLTEYLKKFNLKLKLTQDELSHMILPREGVMCSYVVQSVINKKITDFVSFYILPSAILKQKGHTHDHVRVAYAYYNVGTANPITELMRFALAQAKELGLDVFNALDIMENTEFLAELQFAPGDGSLHYYLYNWHFETRMIPSDIGIVLV